MMLAALRDLHQILLAVTLLALVVLAAVALAGRDSLFDDDPDEDDL